MAANVSAGQPIEAEAEPVPTLPEVKPDGS
jgi:hypothetical protein